MHTHTPTHPHASPSLHPYMHTDAEDRPLTPQRHGWTPAHRHACAKPPMCPSPPWWLHAGDALGSHSPTEGPEASPVWGSTGAGRRAERPVALARFLLFFPTIFPIAGKPQARGRWQRGEAAPLPGAQRARLHFCITEQIQARFEKSSRKSAPRAPDPPRCWEQLGLDPDTPSSPGLMGTSVVAGGTGAPQGRGFCPYSGAGKGPRTPADTTPPPRSGGARSG